MNKELLIRIYSTMLQIETKGQSTIMMADCIKGLQEVINTAGSEGNES